MDDGNSDGVKIEANVPSTRQAVRASVLGWFSLLRKSGPRDLVNHSSGDSRQELRREVSMARGPAAKAVSEFPGEDQKPEWLQEYESRSEPSSEALPRTGKVKGGMSERPGWLQEYIDRLPADDRSKPLLDVVVNPGTRR